MTSFIGCIMFVSPFILGIIWVIQTLKEEK